MSTLGSAKAGFPLHCRASGSLTMVCAGLMGLATAPDKLNGSAASSDAINKSRRFALYSITNVSLIRHFPTAVGDYCLSQTPGDKVTAESRPGGSSSEQNAWHSLPACPACHAHAV